MALTYEEFKKIVPKETSTFFDDLLPYLNYYIGRNFDIRFHNTERTSGHKDSKVFFLSLYALSNLKEYMAFLGEQGFRKNDYDISDGLTLNCNKETLYEKFNYLLPVYDDKSLYYGLQPLEIVLDAYKKYYSNCDHHIFDSVFSASSLNSFKQRVINLIEEKKQIQDREIEKEIYNQVPISVISHIETASKIRTLLLNKLSYAQNGIAKELDVDIVPLSLLLALYYNTNTMQTKDNLNNQGALVCLLEEKGITLDRILKVLNVNLTASEIKSTPKNIYAIKDLYSKYYKVGNNININPTNVSIQGIIKCILDRSFTNSLVIEKLLSSLNCSIDMFKNIETDTIRAVEIQKRNQEQESVKSFYKDIPKKTRDFMEFAVKTYTLLLEKMNLQQHNDKILSTEKDAAILALYISSVFFNGKISEFFSDNGISFNKILKLINIEIKKEEIEKIEVDRNILVEKFRRFVYEGENRNQSTSRIGITEICYNMCNRDFNQSMILENIFNSIATDVEINSNFLGQLKDHFNAKAKKIEIEKTQKLFYDMPVDSITIVENASRIYGKLLKSKKGLDKKGAQSISILLSALNSNNRDIKEFLSNLGFYSNNICSYFDIDSRYLLSSPIDIDVLSTDYGLLMFGLENKDKKRTELTPINMIRNIFSKDFNNSVAISKFLAETGLTYDDFKDIDSLYQKYIVKKEIEKRIKSIKDNLGNYPNETVNQIKNAARVHTLIEEAKQKGNFQQELIKSDSDMEALCMVFALFCDSNKIRHYFEKKGIDTNKLTTMFNLSPDLLYNFSSVDIDYDLIKERYQKYLECGLNKNKTYVSDLFRNLISKNPFVKTIVEAANCEYDIIEREIKTGKEYEDTITVEDRVTRLAKQEVETLDSTSMQSILDFGNALLPHSKYIHSELPTLMKNDANEKSISAISNIISEIYTREEPEKQEQGLFSRIFGGTEVEAKPKFLINGNKLYELKRTINDNIDHLKKELLQYDAIRKYIEEYAIRNRSYYQVAENAVETVSTRLTELDSDDEEQYAEYLTTSSLLQIINDKATRFATVNLLMRKELLKVNQAIVNHFITINSLEMARDDLIPLIESELAIAQGQNSENEALDLSRNIMGLFQSLLTRNVDSAIQNMNKLEKASIPEELMNSINNDINTYLQGVTQVKALETRIESMEEKTEDSKEKVLEKKEQAKPKK